MFLVVNARIIAMSNGQESPVDWFFFAPWNMEKIGWRDVSLRLMK